MLFWGSVSCSRTQTCSPGSRIKWRPESSLNHLSYGRLRLMSSCHNRRCIIIMSKSANAKKTRTRKMRHILKCSADHELLDQSAFQTGEPFILITELWKHPFSQLCWIIYQNWGGKKTYMSTVWLLRNASSQNHRMHTGKQRKQTLKDVLSEYLMLFPATNTKVRPGHCKTNSL